MDCPDGHDYCNDELLIDWTPRGDQVYINMEHKIYMFTYVDPE